MPPERTTIQIEELEGSGSGALSEVRESVEINEDFSNEAIEQELAALRAQVARKEKLAELQALRMRLAGEMPTSSSDNLKRSMSSLNERPRKRLRAKTPPTFTGKSLRELHEYDAAWKIFLEASDEESEPEQIRLAATFLRDIAQGAWSRSVTRPVTWEGYIKFLRRTVAVPTNRMAIASLRLKELKQRETQSVGDLVNYVEKLEEDWPILTPEEDKAWRLLNSLRPELRREVLRENKAITSREQVMASAQRQEDLFKILGSTPSAPLEAPKKKDRLPLTEVECFKCGNKGHMKRDCPGKGQ